MMLNIKPIFYFLRATLTGVFLFVAIQSYTQYNSLLWKISGNGLQQPSFLYGTMHTKDARVFAFGDSVMPAFNSTAAYAMELDVEEVVSPALLGKLMMGGRHSIQKMMPAAEYHRLDSLFKIQSKGLSVKLFDNLSPMLLLMMLETQALGLSDSSISGNEEALDVYFFKEARKQHKKRIGIETIEEQMQAINSLSYKEQAAMLTEALQEKQRGTAASPALLQHYTNQQLDSLLLLNEAEAMPPKFYKALITDRNARMAQRMEAIIRQQSTFIAVGALHLPGSDGVIARLRQKGFTVLPHR